MVILRQKDEHPEKVIPELLMKIEDFPQLEKVDEIKLNNLLLEIKDLIYPIDNILPLAQNCNKNVLQQDREFLYQMLRTILCQPIINIHNCKKISQTQLPLKLIYLRTLLQKLKPIESKLQYQISKHLSQTQIDANPLTLQANPQLLVANSIKQEKQVDGNQIYVAPKLAPTLSPGDLAELKQKKKEKQRQQHLLLKPIEAMYNELTDDTPQIMKKNRIGAREAQIEQYEEENFTRIQIKKKDRIQMNKQRVNDEKVDDWKDIQNISKALKIQGLTEEEGDYGQQVKKKKKLNKVNPDLQEFGKRKNKKIFKKK